MLFSFIYTFRICEISFRPEGIFPEVKPRLDAASRFCSSSRLPSLFERS